METHPGSGSDLATLTQERSDHVPTPTLSNRYLRIKSGRIFTGKKVLVPGGTVVKSLPDNVIVSVSEYPENFGRLCYERPSWCVCGRLILGGDKCHQKAKGSQVRHPECVSLPPGPSRKKPLAVDVAQEEELRRQ